MKKVINWIKALALAEHGFDPNKMELAEFERKATLSQKMRERVDALNEMASGYGQMSATQFAEVMTTANFIPYFSDALSRLFYSDYNDYTAAWREYTYADTTPDFRDVKRFRMEKPGEMRRRREKAEAKPTNTRVSEIAYGVEEYAQQFDVSWQAIVNDDLGKIREMPQMMVKAATRFEDQFVSNLYDNATTQATLAALGAPWAGTGRLTPENLAIGINAMRRRVDAVGNKIQIKAVWLVIPPELAIQAETILRNLLSYGGPNGNVLSNFIAGYKIDPYIATNPPNVPWYLFADPREIPVVTVARLQDWDRPAVFKKRSNIEMISGNVPAPFLMGSAETGDIEFIVETVIGGWDSVTFGGVTDYRGLYYSSGTTP